MVIEWDVVFAVSAAAYVNVFSVGPIQTVLPERKEFRKNMKRTISFFLSAVILLTAASFALVSSAAGIEYSLSVQGSNCTVTGYYGNATDLVIPSTVSGYTVTAVGAGAFKNNTALKSVTLPDTVKSVGMNAFFGCTSLSSVDLSKVETIDSRAFSGCSSLTSVTLPSTLATLWSSVFSGTAITEIAIPASLTTAKASVVNASVTVGETAYTVENAGPFFGCDTLKNVTFADGTEKIPTFLFAGCTSIEEITLPNGVASVEQGAFADCVSLEKITVPASVTSIAPTALDCPDVTVIYGKKNSAAETFASDYGFKFVIDGVTSVKITSLPEKLTYERRESLDLTGMIFVAVTEDGEFEVTDYSVSGYSSTRYGQQTVTVTYGGFSATFNVTVSAPSLLGDVNGDGYVRSSDVILLRSYIAGGTVAGFVDANADVNGDGRIRSTDVAMLRSYLAGNIAL